MKCFNKVVILLLVIVTSQCNGLWKSRSRDTKPRLSGSDGIATCDSNLTCPTWFICGSNKHCRCGKLHDNAVVCDNINLSSAVLDCHCVTYDQEVESTFLGACFYNCEGYHDLYTVYKELPTQRIALTNESVCADFHRTGLLCGDCEEGHSPFVLSYNLSCVKCPDSHKNWWKFILVAFVPLTFFYFFVVLFNINVTSSRLHGVVWFSQMLSNPFFLRFFVKTVSNSQGYLMVMVKILLLFYNFWNLDLLRSVIPDICLNVTILRALALDYLIALYPFVLILLSYFLIELYDRKCACIVTVWKPFKKMLTVYQKSWNVRTSVVDSFATFFLLSYSKILNVSTDLLLPTQIFKLGSNATMYGLYYSPTISYFGNEHLPYAITALVLCTFFVSIPTITLILYPFQFFQRFISVFPINWHFLHIFIDSFQGCYKDGTEPGTFDCRWFSTLMLLTQPLLLLIFSLNLSAHFFIYAIVIVVIILITTINVQPYKFAAIHYPSTDTNFMFLLIFIFVAALGRIAADRQRHFCRATTEVFGFITSFVPAVYILFLVAIWLVSRAKCIKS